MTFDAHHSLAEAAKRVLRGVVCLVSALAYHELTDQIPNAVWMAIGTKDRAPKAESPSMRFVRFTAPLLADDVVTVHIENVPVKIFGVAKTIVDCYRHRRTIGQSVALEGLQEAIRRKKSHPGRDRPACGAWRRGHGDPAPSRSAHRKWLRRSKTSAPPFGPVS